MSKSVNGELEHEEMGLELLLSADRDRLVLLAHITR